MTLNHALLSLLDAVGTSERHHIVGMDTIDNWPPEALNIFINIGLLTATNPPQSMTCPGCEQHCFMDIQQRTTLLHGYSTAIKRRKPD
jgi:hypothetical protein